MSKVREREAGKEQELPYYHSARFNGEGAIRRAYFALQDTIFETGCNLSTYRIILNGIRHVAVLGGNSSDCVRQPMGW
jgi:hypothetical protein